MRTQSFWESIGYDFDDIWVMSDANGPFQGYPIFQWQNVCRHEIYTEADLRNLADEVRAGDSKAGCTYVLMADLNLAGTAYLPIGTVTTVFSGTFEGNYHTISNLSGNDKSLFRSLANNAAVRNLSITNAHITTPQTTVEMAILVWYNNGIVENCYVQGSITAPTVDNIGHGKGGIVSQNTPTGVVRNCFVNVQLTGRHRLAGIAGKNAGTIENCYSTGKLLGTDQINGGIVGQNNSLVKNCVNIMPTITGLPATGSYGTYRVYSYGGTGVNNYSLNTTTINGSTVTTGTTSNYNGQNATSSQLRTKPFWESIGYDFENIWKMSRKNGAFGGYPIFQWQSDPIIFIPGEFDNVLEEKKSVQPTIYPNPTNGVVTIGSTNENPDTRVYDIKGQLLLQTDKTTVDLSSYPNGVYIFNINGEIVKIVKQ